MKKIFHMSNDTYDKLKWIAQVLIPGLQVLYFALAGIWGLPYADKIVGTLAAVDAFLGLCLGISTKNYNKEEMDNGTDSAELSE